MGIDVTRAKLASFTVGAVVAGLAGALVGRTTCNSSSRRSSDSPAR